MIPIIGDFLEWKKEKKNTKEYEREYSKLTRKLKRLKGEVYREERKLGRIRYEPDEFVRSINSVDLDVKRVINQLQHEIRKIKKKIRLNEDPEKQYYGALEDCKRLMTLLCALQARSRGRVHIEGMSFEEQDQMIKDLITLYAASYIHDLNHIPKPTGKGIYYTFSTDAVKDLKKSGVIFCLLMILYLDDKEVVEALRSYRTY